MGRLFWKFFLAFWLALVTAAVGVGIVVSLHQRSAETEWTMPLRPGGFILDAADGVLRAGGPAVLAAALREWRQDGEGGVFVVDAGGTDLLGRAVPAAALAQARAEAEGADGGRDSRPEPVREVRLADGSHYLLFRDGQAARLPGPPGPLNAGPGAPGGPRGQPPDHRLPIAAGLLASLAFSALLAWYLAKPIRNLRWAFEAAAAGYLETRVAPLMGRRSDEIADLGRDFDRMAAQLQGLIAAQQRLLHDVSHELRSPLARLQVAIGLARQRPETMPDALERIEREAGRVDELVGELLTLSRLEAGMDDAPADTVDLVEMVAAIVDDACFEARAAGRDLALTARGEVLATVRAELLYRAFENVIRNAVKYTAAGTTVEVEAGADAAGGFRLTVSDRGPGVAGADLEAIFEPFYRAGKGGVGFGLGLAIARGAVVAHGGGIVAQAREAGGLRVEIRLPVAAPGGHGLD